MSLWNNHNWTPMLLSIQKEPFDSSDYIFEIKYDGYRALIYASPKNVKVINRHHKDITNHFPELQTIKELVKHNVIFDGEIICLDNGLISFQKLQTRFHVKDKAKIKFNTQNNPICFMAFDILYEDKDLISLPLMKRKKILNNYVDSDYFIKVKYFNEKGIKLFENIKKLQLEGIVAKHKDSLYHINTRTKDFIKIKNIKEDVFLIGGFIESNQSPTISLLLGETENNNLMYVGRVSVSKNYYFVKELINDHTKENPFCNYTGGGIFIKKEIKCLVEYLEKTSKNHLRHPVFKTIIKGEDNEQA